MDTFSIIQGIHFSRCSDARKSYYIINTLYNAINIWCLKSASCLLWLLTNGVRVLQSNGAGLIPLQQGRGVNIYFPPTVKKHQRHKHLSFRFTVNEFLCVFLLHFPSPQPFVTYKIKFRWPRSFCLSFLSFSLSALLCFFYTIKTTTLYCWSGAGFPPPFFYRQSIYPDLARIDGCCRDCGVDGMLQDLSTDRHTAWQLQNGASMQPSDLLDFPSPSCFSYYWWFHLCLMKWEHINDIK